MVSRPTAIEPPSATTSTRPCWNPDAETAPAAASEVDTAHHQRRRRRVPHPLSATTAATRHEHPRVVAVLHWNHPEPAALPATASPHGRRRRHHLQRHAHRAHPHPGQRAAGHRTSDARRRSAVHSTPALRQAATASSPTRRRHRKRATIRLSTDDGGTGVTLPTIVHPDPAYTTTARSAWRSVTAGHDDSRRSSRLAIVSSTERTASGNSIPSRTSASTAV